MRGVKRCKIIWDVPIKCKQICHTDNDGMHAFDSLFLPSILLKMNCLCTAPFASKLSITCIHISANLSKYSLVSDFLASPVAFFAIA